MVLSVDRAGVLRFLAFWVASRGGSSGIRLFIAIYAFFFCVGTVIGNDPVILSGVPFLAYFTRETGIDPPTAWIFCQFINANIGEYVQIRRQAVVTEVCPTASTVLVSSNPTNLVLSGAFSISYFVYTAKVILPVLAATFATLPVLLAMFRNPRYIPRKMRPITLNPRSALVDPVGGVFSSAVLILTLGTLVATSTLHPPLYLVTLPPAILVLIRDILYDLRNCRSKKLKLGETPTGPKADAPLVLDTADMDSKEKTQNIEVQEEHGDETLVGMGHNGEGVPPTRPTEQESANLSTKEQSIPQRDGVETLRVSDTGATAEGLHLPISKARETPGVSDTGATEEGLPLPLSKAHETPISFLQRTFPTVTAIFKIMPFSLVIFSLSLFILVQGLAVTGWVDIWAQWWGAWTEKTGLVGTVFGMGLTSCILSNVGPYACFQPSSVGSDNTCQLFGTNIGATILLARVLQVWIQNSSQTPSSRVQDGAIYTLALGSNYGAFTFSFPASLAGLLWRKLLLSKGIKVKMSQFALLNLLPCAIAMATSCSVLLGEIYITHR